MNKYLRIFIATGFILIIVFYALSKINSTHYVLAEEGIDPLPSTFTIEKAIYFMNDEVMLEPEQKTLLIYGNDFVSAVIEELKKEPSDPTHVKVIDKGLKVISSEIVSQKLYLNLSKELIDSSIWQERYKEAIIYSIVNSLAQFDTIDRVQIKVEGTDISAYFNDELPFDLIYNSAIVFTKPATPEEVIITFLNFVDIERYDLAFDMTIQSNSNDVMRAQFINEMKKYRKAKASYEISQPFSKREKDKLSVIVNYQYRDDMRNITYDGGTEEWFLIELSEENHKVVWPRLMNK